MTKVKFIVGNKEIHIVEIETSKFLGSVITVDGIKTLELDKSSDSVKIIKFKVGKNEEHHIEAIITYNKEPPDGIIIKVDGEKKEINIAGTENTKDREKINKKFFRYY